MGILLLLKEKLFLILKIFSGVGKNDNSTTVFVFFLIIKLIRIKIEGNEIRIQLAYKAYASK